MTDRKRSRPRAALLATTIALLATTIACGGGAPEQPAADAPGPAGPPGNEEPATMQRPVASNAFYYYDDLDAAWRFYTEVLGFETAADFGFAKILHVAPTSYLTLVDAAEGMHSAEEPKSVTLAIVTDEVAGWWEYLSAEGIEMRHDFEPEEGRPHVGFVAVDPEGYFLEFERFEPHPENERLLPVLDALEPVFSPEDLETRRPRDLGVRATVLWLYYRDTAVANDFYTRLLGERALVDQGWAWGFRASPSGLIGVVDSERGLHQATEDKAVTVSFFVDSVEDWQEYLRGVDGFEFRDEEIGDESGRVQTLVGFDPEDYFLEWDTFLPVDGNERLLQALAGR
jgi:catechol 2,3-dioxygenase-like lactoylglutathione lyase family enzyme